MFFRNRAIGGEADLADLVHQTAMYHEDRLGGGGFARVVLAGASLAGVEQAERLRRGIEERVGGRVELLDVRGAAAMRDRITRQRRSCSTRWRRRSACCCASAPSPGPGGWPDAAHEPLDPSVLQRARWCTWCCAGGGARRRRHRAERRDPWSGCRGRTRALRRDSRRPDRGRRTSRAARRDIRQGIDQDELKVLVGRGAGGERADRPADVLVDRVLQPLEATLPPDVMLASVRPEVSDEGTQDHARRRRPGAASTSTSSSRSSRRPAQFDRGLQRQVNPAEDGQVQGTIDILYVPTTEPGPETPSAPAGAEAAGRAAKGASR